VGKNGQVTKRANEAIFSADTFYHVCWRWLRPNSYHALKLPAAAHRFTGHSHPDGFPLT
jgi:hypothetical protein